MPVERPAFQETTSLGAAIAAGLAIGMYTHDQVFAERAANVRTFNPAMPAGTAAGRCASWTKAVERSFELADLA